MSSDAARAVRRARHPRGVEVVRENADRPPTAFRRAWSAPPVRSAAPMSECAAGRRAPRHSMCHGQSASPARHASHSGQQREGARLCQIRCERDAAPAHAYRANSTRVTPSPRPTTGAAPRQCGDHVPADDQRLHLEGRRWRIRRPLETEAAHAERGEGGARAAGEGMSLFQLRKTGRTGLPCILLQERTEKSGKTGRRASPNGPCLEAFTLPPLGMASP